MTVSYFTERIGLVMKKSWVYAIVTVFVFATAYLMVFAFWHRTNTELLFLILSIYALASVSISFLSVYLWNRTKQRAKAASNRRLHRFLTHLSTPAMLWDDGMNHILINDRLRKIIGTDAESEEAPDPNLLLPLLFNKEEFNEDALKEIVSSNQKEYSFMTENGVRHDMIWNTSVVETDDKGISKFISIGTDLAEIRAMESELKYYTKKLAAKRRLIRSKAADDGKLQAEELRNEEMLQEARMLEESRASRMRKHPGGTGRLPDLRMRKRAGCSRPSCQRGSGWS